MQAHRFDLALITGNANYKNYFEGNPNWRVVNRCLAAVLYQKRLAGSTLP
jgi:hypothetical protein